MGQTWSRKELVTQFAFPYNEQRAVFCWSSPAAADKGFESKKDMSNNIIYIDVK